MRSLKWFCLLLSTSLWASPVAAAQVVIPLRAERELYTFAKILCGTEAEHHLVAPDEFGPFDQDIGGSLYGCVPPSQSYPISQQKSMFLADSIFIQEHAESAILGDALVSIARSDASITFRLETGKRYSYRFLLSIETGVTGSGSAWAHCDLSTTGGVVRESVHVDATPEHPFISKVIDHHGALSAGEYTLEAHASSDAGWVDNNARLWLMLTFPDAVAVAPSTWGQIKGLYR